MDEQMQQQIIALVLGAMQGDQQAQQQVQLIMQAAQLGNELAIQLALMILQVAQQLQQQLVLAAKFGAKLNYIKYLKGKCPEGYEMQYFKSGGTLCKKCVAKKKKMMEGGQTPTDPITAFKCGRKMKKDNGRNITLKSETSSKNKYGDTVTTRKWSDGTRSRRYTPEEGETIYEGRNGERGVAQLDSLERTDWRSKVVPRKNK